MIELYNRWLRGARLEQSDDPDDFDDSAENTEPVHEAEKVTRLLHIVFPECVYGVCFDARRSPAALWKDFARCGWAAAPPRAGKLLKLLVEVGEGNCAFHRRMLPPGHPGFARTQHAYLNTDENARFNGPNVEPEDLEDLEHDGSHD